VLTELSAEQQAAWAAARHAELGAAAQEAAAVVLA